MQVVRKEMRRVQAMRRKLGAVNLIQRTWRTWKVRAPCLPPLYSGMSSTRQRLILPLLRSTVPPSDTRVVAMQLSLIDAGALATLMCIVCVHRACATL